MKKPGLIRIKLNKNFKLFIISMSKSADLFRHEVRVLLSPYGEASTEKPVICNSQPQTPEDAKPNLPVWRTDPESSLKELESGQPLSLRDIGKFLESLTWLEEDATCVRFNLNKLSLSDYDAAVEKYGETVCDIASKLVSSLYNQITGIPTLPERMLVINQLLCFDDNNTYRLLRFWIWY